MSGRDVWTFVWSSALFGALDVIGHALFGITASHTNNIVMAAMCTVVGAVNRAKANQP